MGTSSKSAASVGGALADLTYEQILEYLDGIEKELDPSQDNNEVNLMSKMQEKQSKIFPYRERYLEHVVNQENNAERYQTRLAEIYIDNLFKI